MNAQKYVEINIMRKLQMEHVNYVIKGVKDARINFKPNALPA